jgi:DNA-binding response OmpR family regulator
MTELKTILLVEDNAQDEQLILLALRNANLANHVDVVRDGQQALDWLFGEGEFPDRSTCALPAVVLLDLNLPRVNGMDVLRRLRVNPRTRLLLAASHEEEDRIRGYEFGANSFVQKPLDFGEFAETVARLGVYWLAVNAPPPRRDGRG